MYAKEIANSDNHWVPDFILAYAGLKSCIIQLNNGNNWIKYVDHIRKRYTINEDTDLTLAFTNPEYT